MGRCVRTCDSHKSKSQIGGVESQHPTLSKKYRNDYDEETTYESYMNPEPGFQSGPGDSVDAD